MGRPTTAREGVAILVIAIVVSISALIFAARGLATAFAQRMDGAIDNAQPDDLEGRTVADPPPPPSESAAPTEPVICEHPPSDCSECKEKISECMCSDCGKK